MEELPEQDIAVEDQHEEQAETRKSGLPTWIKYLLAGLGIALMIGYLFATGWGGYAVAYMKCGVRQPLIAQTVQNSKLYYTPDNRRYSVPGEGAFFNEYFCTEQQAKAAGFLHAGP